MTLPRTVGDVLGEHVVLEVECIDRMYLNVYVPQLQYVEGVISFLRRHRGHLVASTAPVAPISDAFLAGINRFIADEGVDLVHFAKGQRKDDVMHGYLRDFDRDEGILFVGRAQEKVNVFRTEKRRNKQTGKTYPWIVKTSAVVNQHYIYAVDEDFGPFFLKFCGYFPYNAKLCINGNEWAKRQATKSGIAFEALDNGFADCDDPRRLQRICDRLGPGPIDRLTRKWLRRLPHPFTAADRRAGYRYEISMLQVEFSLTQMLDRPASGRVSSRRSSVRISTSAAPTGSRPSSTVGSSRAAADPRRRGSVLGSSPRASPHRYTPSTSTPTSSSTTRNIARYGPRPPSTTPATSTSAAGCATCPRCGRSASPPTDVSSTSNVSPTTRSSERMCSTGSLILKSSRTSAPQRCASVTPASTRCSKRS